MPWLSPKRRCPKLGGFASFQTCQYHEVLVKLIVTSQNQETLDLWREVMVEVGPVEFGANPVGVAGLDAVVISGKWAFDRYGGRPNREHAQVLNNERGDGLPRRIIVPPFLPVVIRDGEVRIREDYENISPTYFAFLESLLAASSEFDESCRVAFDLPLLGMDQPSDEITPRSAARAIRAWLNEYGGSLA